MTPRQSSDTIEDIYGFDVSESFIRASRVLISDFTDKIVPQIEEWQNRLLDDVCPVIYIDAIHYFSRRQRSDCQKAAYGHLEKLAFCDFFEIATSCNSLDYRELQHRIFKVTSKNCSF